ncbi:hypothetical protein [Roseibium sp.]|uniref:hypothetical protein n=1 Tax=Roseibium sp. TaxID=1936156 RepID=UPI003D13971D
MPVILSISANGRQIDSIAFRQFQGGAFGRPFSFSTQNSGGDAGDVDFAQMIHVFKENRFSENANRQLSPEMKMPGFTRLSPQAYNTPVTKGQVPLSD